ncbi:MAG: TIGR00730 family Rossman fold protein [Bacteroidales bacterium]|jgi:uncharacterized protein (TIGR00730 family)
MTETNNIKTICVFCGSSSGSNPMYVKKAGELGEYLAKNNITLIYGGSKLGLMQTLADAVLENNGEVIGIMPKDLIKFNIAKKDLTQFIEVDNMHERKQIMIEKSDAVIALPGGLGTLDELFEIISLNQMGITSKPVALFNILGYYNKLLDFIKFSISQKFIKEEYVNQLIISDNISEIFENISNFENKTSPYLKWANL